jgi:DNA polymerase-3 subunit delta
MLESVFGSGAKVSAPDIEPYLGVSGDVAPWDLTDAIDGGDVSGSLDVLHRMMIGGGRHPIQILATLSNHYLKMIRLDDPDIRGDKQAADVLGMKGSTFPAKKALDGARRLGSDRLAEIATLLAQADLDLHGAKAWPAELVVEVLVARLAGRSRAVSNSSRSGRR